MPEFYYGVADPDFFGLSGNFIYPFKVFSSIDDAICGNWSWIIKIEDDVRPII
jgi:hypothetical protein